jgi:hypothetical protein
MTNPNQYLMEISHVDPNCQDTFILILWDLSQEIALI